MAATLSGLLATLAMLCIQVGATASQAPSSSDASRQAIEQFLMHQTANLSGRVGITIDAPMLAALPPCATPEPFLPSGARLWGRLSVGLRCSAQQPWTRYVSAYVSVAGVYYVAAHQIMAGQTLTAADAQERDGDLTTLPGGVVVDPAQLIGVIASNRIAAGAPLRRESLRSVVKVQQGQTVKVLTQGNGFVVSTEGRAMTNGPVGALIQVKTQGGQLLSGIVRLDGTVERPP